MMDRMITWAASFRRSVGGGRARHSERLTSIGQATHFVFDDVASVSDDRRRLLMNPVCNICNISSGGGLVQARASSVGCCVKVYARALFTPLPIGESLKKLFRGKGSFYFVVRFSTESRVTQSNFVVTSFTKLSEYRKRKLLAPSGTFYQKPMWQYGGNIVVILSPEAHGGALYSKVEIW
jgi:hypothetical protein